MASEKDQQIAGPSETANASPTPTLTEGRAPKGGSFNNTTPDDLAKRPTLIEDVVLAEKPKGAAFALIVTGLYLAMYLFCLDISIVAPAIPPITDHFGDSSKATWFFSVYLALNTAFQPFFGDWYRLAPKWTFLVSTAIFLVGSLICAVANGSDVFIFGRALAGVGASGGYIGVLAIIAVICEPHEVAKWANMAGGIYALGAVSGPLIGGAFTTHVTWRWCFYINLPIGAVTLFACFFLLPQPSRKNFWGDFWIVVKNIDYVGVILVIGALMDLLMLLQWGGLEHDWDSSVIIGLIVGFVLIVAVLVGWIIWRGEKGYLRPRILRIPIIKWGGLQNFAIAASYLTTISVIAFYFQIRGSSAIRSGVQLLPLIVGVILGLFLSGGLAPVIGYVNPFLLIGMIIMIIAQGLIYNLDAHSSTANWAGTTLMLGVGAGLSFMMAFISAQNSLSDLDREAGTTHVLFPQTLGGAIIFGIGQSIFLNKFKNAVNNIPGLPDPDGVVQGGITAWRDTQSAEFIPILEDAAIGALKNAYVAPIAVLGLAILFAWPFTPWHSVKPPSPEAPEGATEPSQEKKSAV